jgi:hypothetical protein
MEERVEDTATQLVMVTEADAAFDAALVADRNELLVELLLAVRVEVGDGVSTKNPSSRMTLICLPRVVTTVTRLFADSVPKLPPA